MIIYSSKFNATNLDQYVGLDIWVKVNVADYGEIYARLVKKTDTDYWYNGLVDNDGPDDLDEILHGELTCDFNEIKLVRPVDTKTTKEIIAMVKNLYNFQ